MRVLKRLIDGVRSKNQSKPWVVSAMVSGAAALGVMGSQAAQAQSYQPNWESLAGHNEAPEWFKDAKLGIYFHWGVYSVPAYGNEWYPRWMHFPEKGEHKHHAETYGSLNEFGYHDFVPMFKAEHFDADEWADLFKQSGARFAGPVAEHHDGFSMWDSKANPWNVKNKGPKKDITGELAKAIKDRDMKLIATFHHARNAQRYADQPAEATRTDIRSHRRFNNSHYPFFEGTPPTSTDPELRLLYGNLSIQDSERLWMDKLVEVVDQYDPDIVWFDSWLHEISEAQRQAFCAYYLNEAAQKDQEVVICFKQKDLPMTVGIEDFEKGRLDKLVDHTWMTDDTISKGSWSYTHDLTIKPTSQVLHVFLDIISKNGVLLLNISPMADGTIPQNQRDTLLGMGGWLKHNGEAVYDTRPWHVFGEGPTRLAGSGHFVHKKGGYLKYTPKDIRYTTKPGAIYATVLGWPGDGETVTLASFAPGAAGQDEVIDSVSMIGVGGALKWSRDDQGLHVTMPTQGPEGAELAVVIKLNLK